LILTSSAIVAQIQNYAGLGINQAGLTSAQIMQYATLEMEWMCSEIIGQNENFLVYQDSIPATAGQALYRFPYRAIGGVLNHIAWENTDGSKNILDRAELQDTDWFNATDETFPQRFYVTGNYINILPTPTINGTLEVFYPFMPSPLTIESACPAIISVDYASNSVTVASAPSNFANQINYDIIDHLPGNGIVYYDLLGSVSGNTITFPQAIPNVQVGNYIAQAQQSPVPMVPEVLHKYVVELTAARIEIQRGSTERAKLAAAVIQDIKQRLPLLIGNRLKSKPKSVGGLNPFRRIWGLY
jgi:hypothetical protein